MQSSKIIIGSILKHNGPKTCEIWVNKNPQFIVKVLQKYHHGPISQKGLDRFFPKYLIFDLWDVPNQLKK
jgi:hypothetical protein